MDPGKRSKVQRHADYSTSESQKGLEIAEETVEVRGWGRKRRLYFKPFEG